MRYRNRAGWYIHQYRYFGTVVSKSRYFDIFVVLTFRYLFRYSRKFASLKSSVIYTTVLVGYRDYNCFVKNKQLSQGCGNLLNDAKET